MTNKEPARLTHPYREPTDKIEEPKERDRTILKIAIVNLATFVIFVFLLVYIFRFPWIETAAIVGSALLVLNLFVVWAASVEDNFYIG